MHGMHRLSLLDSLSLSILEDYRTELSRKLMFINGPLSLKVPAVSIGCQFVERYFERNFECNFERKFRTANPVQ